jgi:hypothetical protein
MANFERKNIIPLSRKKISIEFWLFSISIGVIFCGSFLFPSLQFLLWCNFSLKKDYWEEGLKIENEMLDFSLKWIQSEKD